MSIRFKVQPGSVLRTKDGTLLELSDGTLMVESQATSSSSSSSSSSSATPPVPPTPIPIPTPPPTPAPPPPTPPGPIDVPNQDLKVSTVSDLIQALNAAIPAGSTIWLRGGEYIGRFISKLKGTSNGPIRVRAYPNERPRLIGAKTGGGAPILKPAGDHVWFQGLELAGQPSTRYSKTNSGSASYPTDLNDFANGIELGLPDAPVVGVKFINCFVHDTQQGFSLWTPARDIEIYGCFTFFNGWDGESQGQYTRGHGHGMYIQNDTGTKEITDCVLFSGFAVGIQCYGEKGVINNLKFRGNIGWNNGELAKSGLQRNLLIGGSTPADSPVIKENYFWYPSPGDATFNLGYYDTGGGSQNAVIQGNVFSSRCSIQKPAGGILVDGNIIGQAEGFQPSEFPHNTYGRPTTGQGIFVRPNKYERGRAHVAVFNWNSAAIAAIDLGGTGIKDGERFQVFNAADPFGAPLRDAHFTAAGGPLILPLNGLKTAQPLGSDIVGKATSPSPAFACFLIKLV